MKKGNLSINSENIFPVIKKWLYSDHDIFVREMISNACDAISKYNKLSLIGELEKPNNYKERIDVIASPENKTLTFIDNGIGMTEDELIEYLTQIAFSGATSFLEKYKDKTNDDQIIGHFGLGFYSAFMVADRVVVETLSYKKDSKAVKWSCDGGIEYTLSDSGKTEVGTKITLYLNDSSLEFANEYRLREVLDKYCSFMPYEIYLKVGTKVEYETINEEDLKEDDKVIERTTEEVGEGDDKKTINKVKIEKREHPINDIHPLWTKAPSECTDEEYNEFYRKVFHDYKEPLFKIHLNMDYPFNLKGILYFPKINTEYDSIEGTIKLYNTQVFVADNVKEVIPEFLLLLKGVIDCPDLPLNVSRSALQNDGFAKKIADYIAKKVADKLTGMCKTDRSTYESYWEDIGQFIKYGCLKDDKFMDKLNDYILFKKLDHSYTTLSDLIKASKEEQGITEDSSNAPKEENNDESNKEASKDKPKVKLYYVKDEDVQASYVNLFKEENRTAVIMDKSIDPPFISLIESRNEDVEFESIDSSLNEIIKSDNEGDLKDREEKLIAKLKDVTGKENLSITLESFKDDSIPAILTISEQSKRMSDMMKAYGMKDFGGDSGMLRLNASNSLVKYLEESSDNDKCKLLYEEINDLAELSNRQLPADRMLDFIKRSRIIMEEFIK